MVLAELGKNITDALSRMGNATIIDDEVIKKMINEITTALLNADVSWKLLKNFSAKIKEKITQASSSLGFNQRRAIQAAVFDELVSLLESTNNPKKLLKPAKQKTNVLMFVGLQGSGKTTTCTKLAYWYKQKGYRVALVCADTFRAGAFDQVKQNATKAKIKFYGEYKESNPVKIAREGVELFKQQGEEIIIVDTSGRHNQDKELFEEMSGIATAIKPLCSDLEIVYIMDSALGQSAYDQAKGFNEQIGVGSVVLTKMDGHSKGGGALSAVAATNAPITFIGTGEHLTELEPFNARSFVSRLLGMGDIGSLAKLVEEKIGTASQTELLQKMKTGLTLRDMYDQFANVLKIGSFSTIMSLIPGLGQDFVSKDKAKEAGTRLKKFMIIMDSMTAYELDSDAKVVTPSRSKRIAKGAGVSIEDVNEVLTVFKPFAKVGSKMGKMMPKSGKMDPRNMDPAQLQSMMSQINPQLMKQMGGAGGLQNMMKQMSKMGMGGMNFPGMK